VRGRRFRASAEPTLASNEQIVTTMIRHIYIAAHPHANQTPSPSNSEVSHYTTFWEVER